MSGPWVEKSKVWIGRGNAVWDGTDAVMLSGEVRTCDTREAGGLARDFGQPRFEAVEIILEFREAFLPGISWRARFEFFQRLATEQFNPSRQQAANTPWKLPLDIEDAHLYVSTFARGQVFSSGFVRHSKLARACARSADEVMAEASAAREAESVARQTAASVSAKGVSESSSSDLEASFFVLASSHRGGASNFPGSLADWFSVAVPQGW